MNEQTEGVGPSVAVIWLTFVLWAIAFWGEPDLVDALIHYLMK